MISCKLFFSAKQQNLWVRWFRFVREPNPPAVLFARFFPVVAVECVVPDDSGLKRSAAAIWFTLGFVRTAALPNNLCSAKMLLVLGTDEQANDVDKTDLVLLEASPVL